LALNKEQSDRVQLAHQLHLHLNHPSDEALKAVLSGGHIPGCHLTAKDVTNMRERDGPCTTCIQAKLHQKSMPPSVTPPADGVGHTLTLDLAALPCPTFGGYTLAVVAVDERSGFFDVVPAKSKHRSPLLDAVAAVITSYRRNGHTTSALVFDPESALCALKLPLEMAFPGITISFCPPGQHAQRVERYVQTWHQ